MTGEIHNTWIDMIHGVNEGGKVYTKEEEGEINARSFTLIKDTKKIGKQMHKAKVSLVFKTLENDLDTMPIEEKAKLRYELKKWKKNYKTKKRSFFKKIALFFINAFSSTALPKLIDHANKQIFASMEKHNLRVKFARHRASEMFALCEMLKLKSPELKEKYAEIKELYEQTKLEEENEHIDNALEESDYGFDSVQSLFEAIEKSLGEKK